jgi:hypothetical protein
MVLEEVVNGLGAFDDEDAFPLSSPFISEEVTNARSLPACQKSGKGRHGRID